MSPQLSVTTNAINLENNFDSVFRLWDDSFNDIHKWMRYANQIPMGLRFHEDFDFTIKHPGKLELIRQGQIKSIAYAIFRFHKKQRMLIPDTIALAKEFFETRHLEVHYTEFLEQMSLLLGTDLQTLN